MTAKKKVEEPTEIDSESKEKKPAAKKATTKKPAAKKTAKKAPTKMPRLRTGAGSIDHEDKNVKVLQRNLNKRGHVVEVDGIFGTETRTAVRIWQRSRRLPVDGIVGKNTWRSFGYVGK